MNNSALGGFCIGSFKKLVGAAMVAVVLLAGAVGAQIQDPGTAEDPGLVGHPDNSASVTAVYVITGSDTSFTATKNGVVVGTAGIKMFRIINAIKEDAKGNACTIQFGNGSDILYVLNYDIALITFNGGLNGNDWGKITLTGKLSSLYDYGNIIELHNGVSVESRADIQPLSYGYGSPSFKVLDNSVLTITSGTIRYIDNNDFGNVTINGGTVEDIIENRNNGIVTINGGTIERIDNYYPHNDNLGMRRIVIRNGNVSKIVNFYGTLTISGGTISDISNDGTVVISGGTISDISNDGTVVISGGTITGGISSPGYLDVSTVDISGGIITGRVSGDKVTINGGTIYGGVAGGTVIISDGTISAIGDVPAVGGDNIIISGTAQIISESTNAPTIVALDPSVVNIVGGTVSNLASNGAVFLGSGLVNLGGSPNIIGNIDVYLGELRVITSGVNAFNPGNKKYIIYNVAPTDGVKAVTNGANFISNFALARTATIELLESYGTYYNLTTKGNDIVISVNDKPVSILATDRNITMPVFDSDLVAIHQQPNLQASEFIAGPNPVKKHSEVVSIFHQGKPISNGILTVYDAAGNVVKKIHIHDSAVINGQARRQIGTWDLTDRKGRVVSDGVYLVRGTITARDGTREKISLLLGVR